MNVMWRIVVDYIEKNLVPGETVLYQTRLHWIVMVWPLLAGVLLGGIGLVFCVGGFEASGKGGSYPGMIIVGILLFFAAVFFAGMGFVRKNSTEVAVSNKRVLIKTGFVSQKSIEVLLSKVESIGVDESGLGRMLGYGSVNVRGTGGTFETFKRIAHPNEFRRQVQQQIGSVEVR
jgi:uncharacterized membrane protein YdbT with pleckstrin-like domain